MSRDQKIGFALGILLVGAVAAFFYRHETPAGTTLPELKSVVDLNREITEQPLAPYVAPRQTPVPEPLPTIDNDVFPEGDAGGLVPDPIALEGERSGTSRTSLASSSQTLPNPGAATSAAAATTRNASRSHVVQRGDTLSSIAAQYLGSANRYEEIYTANRDRLRDANDLRVGQTLNIPARETAPASLPVSPSSPVQLEAFEPIDVPAEAAPKPASRFVPYPGGRSLPARTATPSSAPAAGSGKRLSQLPPDDVIMRR